MTNFSSDFYTKQQKRHSEIVQQWPEAILVLEELQINHVLLMNPGSMLKLEPFVTPGTVKR